MTAAAVAGPDQAVFGRSGWKTAFQDRPGQTIPTRPL
jgi:hypothetical protein